MGDTVTTIPTIGFNVEVVEYKNISRTVWDIGGQDKIRALWRHYYPNTESLIFVVDSCDRKRINTAKDELDKLLADDLLRNSILLIFANKQDLPDAMPPSEMAEKLGLYKLGSRQWYIQACCAVGQGQGIYEGLDWLSEAVMKARK